MGPGSPGQMTIKVRQILERSEVIVGYTVYVELLRKILPEKRYLTTPMRQETQRCRMALEEADRGNLTAVVCSGDAGIYGMAGLIWELGEEYPQVEIEVVPGVTAAMSGSAILGAPVGHDCCLISLSDLLTPWEVIERRLRAAAAGDFVICLYNPSSRKRKDYLERACRILLEDKPGDTICGIVRNIDREGEEARILTLEQLEHTAVDMFSTVFIGNQETRIIRGKMITPRGYRL